MRKAGLDLCTTVYKPPSVIVPCSRIDDGRKSAVERYTVRLIILTTFENCCQQAKDQYNWVPCVQLLREYGRVDFHGSVDTRWPGGRRGWNVALSLFNAFVCSPFIEGSTWFRIGTLRVQEAPTGEMHHGQPWRQRRKGRLVRSESPLYATVVGPLPNQLGNIPGCSSYFKRYSIYSMYSI